MKLTSWAVVVMVGMGIAGFIGLYAIVTDPAGRSALLGVLITSVGTMVAVVVARVGTKVDHIQKQVNGHTEQLIRRLPGHEQDQARADAGLPPAEHDPRHRQT